MRVLIAGCGYVGLALGAELARRSHEVFGLTRTSSRDDELKAAGITPLHGDILQPEDLALLPSHWDWVVNCVSSSGASAEEYRRTYLEGNQNLIAWLAKQPPKKLLFTSSTSVYAQDDGSTVIESSATEPASETARILVETERALLDAYKTSGFPSIIVRVSGIYGPGRGYWIKRFTTSRTIEIGERQRIINMVHRDDVAGGIAAALEKGSAGDVYNITDDEPVSVEKLLAWFNETMPIAPKSPLPQEPLRKSNRSVTNKKISNERLKTRLGYRFKYSSFREGYAAEIAARKNSQPD